MVSIYPPTKGGVAAYTREILDSYGRLMRSNLHITLLADKPVKMSKVPQGFLAPNIEIKRVWSHSVAYIFQILKSLTGKDYDLVHIHHEYFLYGGLFSSAIFALLILLLKAVKLKVIVQIHGIIQLKDIKRDFCRICDLSANQSIVGTMRIGIFIQTFLICKLANVCIVHAKCLKETLIRDYFAERKKIYVIRYGFARPMITPDEAFLKGKKNIHEILFYGFLTGYKGLEILLEAHARLVKEMSNVRLTIAGGNSPRSKVNYSTNLKQMTQKLGIAQRVTFTGFKEPQDMKKYFTNADIFVLPYVYSMASSDALSKAFQFLLPTVASDLGVFREELGYGKRGLLFQAGNEESLKDAIKFLLLHKGERQNAIKNIYEYSFDFSWDTTAKEVYRLWESLKTY